ncbi:hypothetical protein JT358_15660 [Micrococcales bacterium 31B]|nr:hypothetical protein [Micrococcales bacterium 31B]
MKKYLAPLGALGVVGMTVSLLAACSGESPAPANLAATTSATTATATDSPSTSGVATSATTTASSPQTTASTPAATPDPTDSTGTTDTAAPGPPPSSTPAPPPSSTTAAPPAAGGAVKAFQVYATGMEGVSSYQCESSIDGQSMIMKVTKFDVNNPSAAITETTLGEAVTVMANGKMYAKGSANEPWSVTQVSAEEAAGAGVPDFLKSVDFKATPGANGTTYTADADQLAAAGASDMHMTAIAFTLDAQNRMTSMETTAGGQSFATKCGNFNQVGDVQVPNV